MADQGGMNRRRFIGTLGALGLGATWLPRALFAAEGNIIKKAIPASGEQLTVIGMGTSRTFDAGFDDQHVAELQPVLQAFFDHHGQLIDSSPMYGSAESVIGELLKQVSNKQDLFAATKVWTEGHQEGIDQMQRSMQRMGVEVFDLMQIHNLVDWRTHLKTLRQWKEEGKVRYIGITTSHGRFHDQLTDILKREPFDFVQFSYNIDNRDVEQHLLPIALDRGIATLVNRPFQRGSLFGRVKGKPLPAWAADYHIESWAQYFLKYIASHPAVTCAIPATSKVHHMIDNMGAARGPLPDARARKKMYEHFHSL